MDMAHAVVGRGTWLRTLVVAVIALVLPSCGGGSSRVAVAPPLPSRAAWVPAVLGSPADVSLFIRPTAVRADPFWGPLAARLFAQEDRHGDFISHASAAWLSNARQMDMYFTIRDPLRLKGSRGRAEAVGVALIFHGLPMTDPLNLRSGAQRPLFAPPARLPSGVLAYPPDPAYAKEHGIFAPTLFVTPDGTCVLVDQASSPRARDFFARVVAPPPPIEATGDALAGVSFGITTIRFVDADKGARGSFTQGLVGAGVGVRGGASGALEGYADYASDDDADRAYRAFIQSCADKPEKCELEPGMFREARAELGGKRISLTLTFTEALLRSIQNYTP